MDYSGKIITKNAVTPTQTAASGVWTLDDALQAQKGNNWPIPGVPNPISKSLRFNSADSAYLNRTPSIAGNRQKWTWSGWVKRSAFGTNAIFQGYFNTTNLTALAFNSGNTLFLQDYSGASFNLVWETSAVFRDPSAWYHIVFVYDTTQASSANAVKLYVNGVQQTLTFTAYGGSYTQNREGFVNATNVQELGKYSNDNYLNGYMTEINFVDGQALAASDFGMTDTNTGVWIPKKYTGTYGTNGFYLNFKDATNTSTLGLDYSGNGNNWNANNFSVTAGAGNDSLTDVPTPWVGYAPNTEVGGVVRGNYATFNPLNLGSNVALSNGNLYMATSGSNYTTAKANIGVSSGKWYFEGTLIFGGFHAIGISSSSAALSNYLGSTADSYGYFSHNGNKYNNGSNASYGASYTAGDIIGVALDLDAGTLVFYKNGVSQGTAYSGLSGTFFFGTTGDGSGLGAWTANFGQRPFAYTPPAGFKSLCTTNLPTPTIGATSTTLADDYFNTVLYTGTGSSLSVTGVGFQPDFVWIKGRSGVTDHGLYDAVRGVQKQVESNTTALETTETTGLTAFGTDGFTVGALAQLNTSTATYVGWNWKANGAGSSNTAGTISSTVSVNTTSGFSIVTYTGNGIAGATIGHGLGAAPSMIIVKKRTGGAQTNWPVYHKDLGNTKYLDLNSSSNASTDLTRWNNTSPTSTVFTAGDAGSVNGSGFVYVAYCFAPIEGYSAFGSYTGNGSTDGPFVYLGFRPKFVLFKLTSGADSWMIYDAVRNTYNVVNNQLYPNSSSAEYAADSRWYVDFVSNGFKLRGTDALLNGNGSTYIYAAFAESPFKFANAR